MKYFLILFLILPAFSIGAASPKCPNFRAPKCGSGFILKRKGDCRIPYCEKTLDQSRSCPSYQPTATSCSPERYRDQNYQKTIFGNLTCTHDVCARHLYQNPLMDRRCADPAVHYDTIEKRYHLSCTKFPLYHSTNMKDWVQYPTKHRLAKKNSYPSWADYGKDWAPEIAKIGNDFVAYLTLNDATNNGKNTGIIGVAKGATLSSPLIVEGNHVVKNDRFGVIDPSYFKDPKDGKHYLLFKLDTNKYPSENKPTRIVIRELRPDGLRFKGGTSSQTLILGGSTFYTLIEGQDMIEKDGYYYLFYSIGAYTTNYHVRVVRSTSPLGPFDTNQSRAFLHAEANQTNGSFYAPGHGKTIKTADGYYYLYHAKKRLPSNDPDYHTRFPMLDAISFVDGWPILNPGPNQSHPSTGIKFIPKPL
ncbi:MAG: family 43 glycosylhydrolase [Bdellovibrionota bacterium]|nr:family 43 glycosylhydrolase [Bdellovibrionota bacterium]